MRKAKNMTVFNRVVAWLHLWPSLISGLVLVFVCFTGAIIVFADEVIQLSAGEARFVETPRGRPLPLEEILNIHRKKYPQLEATYVIFYRDPRRSLAINTFDERNTRLSMVFMDPYSGWQKNIEGTVRATAIKYFSFIE